MKKDKMRPLQFEVTDLGEPTKIVGIEIDRDRARGTLTISQKQYIEALLEKERLQNGNSVATPMDPSTKLYPSEGESEGRSNAYASLIGSLMYLAVATRPDIAYAVYRLGSFMANPDMSHWTAAKRILRYLSGTREYGITYRAETRPGEAQFVGYADASYACNDDSTSVSGYVFIMSGGAITWASQKQNNVTLSTTESEYSAMADAAKEVVWLRNLFEGLEYNLPRATKLYGDNSGALAIAKNPQYHKRSKHFNTKHHWTRERVREGTIEALWCPTADMMADILTKALAKPKHQHHLK